MRITLRIKANTIAFGDCAKVVWLRITLIILINLI